MVKPELVKLESSFEYFGFHCETHILPIGHRCGYVYIGEEHPLYGLCISDLPDDFDPDVNGGITYSGRIGDRWALGFDFCHCWDIPDEACIAYEMQCFPDECILVTHANDPCARVATLDMAIDDCKKLAELLYAFRNKPFVYTMDEWGYYSDREPDEIVCKNVRYVKDAKSSCAIIEWPSGNYTDMTPAQCSLCGKVFAYEEWNVPRFCPMCGSRVKSICIESNVRNKSMCGRRLERDDEE